MVEHFSVKFGDASFIGVEKQTDTRTNGGENRILVTTVGMGNDNNKLRLWTHKSDVSL